MRHYFWLLVVLVSACSTTKYTHGIPNLVQVRSDVWRSGQPTTLEQWKYLHDELGIRNSVKLDFDSEGTDDSARLFGVEVYSISIEPRTDADALIPAVVDVIERPEQDRIAELKRVVGKIKSANGSSGAWLVHCKNGHDRTGMAIGFIRVLVDGWTKKMAYDEMLARGFHPELIGLVREWHAFEVTEDGK